MSARKRRTSSRSGPTNNFGHGGKKRRTKLNLVHSPSPCGGGASVVQAHEVVRSKTANRLQFSAPSSPEGKRVSPPTSALRAPADPADFSLSQDKDHDQNEGSFIRMTPNYTPPVPGLARQTSISSDMTSAADAASATATSSSSAAPSTESEAMTASTSSSSASFGARSKLFLQPLPPTDSDPKFDLKFTPPSADAASDRSNELFPLSVNSLPDSSADSSALLHLSADSATSTSSGCLVGQSSSSSSSSQNDELRGLSLTPSSSPPAVPQPLGVLMPTESLSRILVDDPLSVGEQRPLRANGGKLIPDRSRDKLHPLFDMDGDAAQALLSLSQNSDKGTTGDSFAPSPPLPHLSLTTTNSLTTSTSNSNSSPTLALVSTSPSLNTLPTTAQSLAMSTTDTSLLSTSSSSSLSRSVPMPLEGGGKGKGKNHMFFNAPVLPPLPPASTHSTSGIGSAASVLPSGAPKYLPPDPQKFPPVGSRSSSSSRSRSRSSRSGRTTLHLSNGDISNGVVPMSDDTDTVVIANPEEQSLGGRSNAAAVDDDDDAPSSAADDARAALASIGTSRSTSNGLDLQTAVFVRDEVIDTNVADPVPTATALTVKCFIDAKGTGADIFKGSRSPVPVCMRIIAQRGTKKFFRGSRVEFIFQGHEFDEEKEENWFDRIFSVEYQYNVAVSDAFCVTLSPSRDQTADVNSLPSALVLTMRITPHLSTAVVSTARRKKQKRRKKTADLEHITLTFQMARGRGDFATDNLLAESTVELYISPRSTWEKQRTKKHRR